MQPVASHRAWLSRVEIPSGKLAGGNGLDRRARLPTTTMPPPLNNICPSAEYWPKGDGNNRPLVVRPCISHYLISTPNLFTKAFTTLSCMLFVSRFVNVLSRLR